MTALLRYPLPATRSICHQRFIDELQLGAATLVKAIVQVVKLLMEYPAPPPPYLPLTHLAKVRQCRQLHYSHHHHLPMSNLPKQKFIVAGAQLKLLMM